MSAINLQPSWNQPGDWAVTDSRSDNIKKKLENPEKTKVANKKSSWLEKFTSLVWAKVQEEIYEANEPSLSILSDKKSLVDASNSLGGENNSAIDSLQEVNPCRGRELNVCLGANVMSPLRKQTEDCKGKDVPRLLIISERFPPD